MRIEGGAASQQDARSPRRLRVVRSAGGPLALAAAFAALAAWSWQRQGDVQIDFGNELYVAWRLASGDHLYRDIALRHGPLSHYLNAGVFRVFGASIRALVLCNLAILAGTTALAWALLRPACGRFAATLAGLVLLGGFGFSHTLAIGNYSWVAPYQHFQTHGVALGMALALLAGRALRGDRPRLWALAGACLGLVFLTKAELCVPAAAAAAAALALEAAAAGGASLRAAAARLALGAALPVALAFALLAAAMPARLALEGVLGNWSHLGGVLSDPFYRGHLGLDAPARNAGRALRALATLAVFAGACALADRALAGRRRKRALALAAGATLFGALAAAGPRVAWHELARALPLTSALGAGVLAAACARRRADREALARLAPLALFALLGLGLLAKLAFAARFDHYGFALAMPATLLLVVALVRGVGALRPAAGGFASRALATAAVAAALLALLGETARQLERRPLPVGAGGDRILAERPSANPRAERIAEALTRLEALLPRDATLLVMPEGASLNYWLRRRNPSRYLLFLPTEIAAFGERAMLADLARHPPDFVVLAHRRHEEFGVGPFGRDPRNGRGLRAWIDAHYERVARIGPEPFGTGGFGLVILRRTGAGAAVEAPPEARDRGVSELRSEPVTARAGDRELGVGVRGAHAAVHDEPLGRRRGPLAPAHVDHPAAGR